MFFHYQSDAMPYTVPRGITWSGVKESSMTSRRTSKTRNAWQSLAYSPLGAPWRIQMTHTYLLIAALPSSPAPYWTYLKSPQKIFDADCTTSYVLNSGVTEPNLTKFLRGVQKWLPITLLKSKLWYSNPFGIANCYEWRSSSNCDDVSSCSVSQVISVGGGGVRLYYSSCSCTSYNTRDL